MDLALQEETVYLRPRTRGSAASARRPRARRACPARPRPARCRAGPCARCRSSSRPRRRRRRRQGRLGDRTTAHRPARQRARRGRAGHAAPRSRATGGCCSSAASRTQCTACSCRARCTARRTSAPARRPSPVGVCGALEADDRVAGTYRGHGHALALGAEPQALLDELLGRATGVCGGRAGSMNVVDLEHGLIGCFGIVGGSIAAATGAALARKRTGRRRGRLLRRRRHQPGLLPRVPELRAGLRAAGASSSARTTSTASSRRWQDVTAGADIAGARRGLGIPAESRRRQRRVGGPRGRRARPSTAPARGDGPALLECETYRHVGHSKSTRPRTGPRASSSAGASATRSTLARARLLDARRQPSRTIAGREPRSSAELERAIEAALAAPFPDPADAADGVRAVSDEPARVPQRDPRRARRGARARRAVVFFGEDVAAAGGVFKATAGPARAPRRRARLRHADLRAGARRRRVRRGGHRAAPGDRDHVRRLPGARDGQPRQPVGQVLVHLQRAGHRAARRALGGRRRRALRRDPLADPGTWFQGVPGLKIVVPVDARRRQGPAQGGDPRRQPGALPRAQAPLLGQGRGAPTASPSPHRPGAVVRAGRDLTLVSVAEERARRAGGRRAARRARASTPRSSTCARCARSTSATVLASVAKTNRLLAVEEGPRTGGWAGELLGAVAEQALARPRRRLDVATDETPIPYSPPLEDAFLPGADAIAASVRERLGAGGPRERVTTTERRRVAHGHPAATLRDVALLAGVHPGDGVAGAEPGHPRARQRGHARRVLDAADELGYRPNPIARSLKTSRSYTVGVVVPDLTNPLFPPIVRGIEDALDPAGYTACSPTPTTTRPGRRRSRGAAREAGRRLHHGVAPGREHRALEQLHDRACRSCSPPPLPRRAIPPSPRTTARATRLAVEHLAGLGHRGSRTSPGRRRSRPASGATRGSSRPWRPQPRRRSRPRRDRARWTEAEGARLCARAARPRRPTFTALIAAHDLMALGCSTCWPSAAVVPADICVVGFNDMPFATRFSPPLTTVRVPHYELGVAAADLLLERIADPGAPRGHTCCRVDSSCAAPPGRCPRDRA